MSYPVGSICIGQKFVMNLQYNGMQCEIISPCRHMDSFCNKTFTPASGPAYRVRFVDGTERNVLHENLKRKDWYDEEKRAEYQMRLKSKDRDKVSKLIAACKKAAESAIEAGEKVNQEEGLRE